MSEIPEVESIAPQGLACERLSGDVVLEQSWQRCTRVPVSIEIVQRKPPCSQVAIDVRERVGVIVRPALELRFDDNPEKGAATQQLVSSKQHLKVAPIGIDFQEIELGLRRKIVVERHMLLSQYHLFPLVEVLSHEVQPHQLLCTDRARARIGIYADLPLLGGEQRVEVRTSYESRFVSDIGPRFCGGHLPHVCHERIESDRMKRLSKGAPIMGDASAGPYIDESEIADRAG